MAVHYNCITVAIEDATGLDWVHRSWLIRDGHPETPQQPDPEDNGLSAGPAKRARVAVAVGDVL